jgi:hypothetical protein
MAKPLITADQFYAELRRYGLEPTGIKRQHIEVWRRVGSKDQGTVPIYIGFVGPELLIHQLAQFGLDYVFPEDVNWSSIPRLWVRRRHPRAGAEAAVLPFPLYGGRGWGMGAAPATRGGC